MTKLIQIQTDLQKAMKAKEADKVTLLRSLVAAAKNKQIEVGHELTEEELQSAVKKEAKKREEAIVMYQQAGRNELLEREKFELQLIKEYLPKALTLEEIKQKLQQMKQGGNWGKDFGAVMKQAMAEFKGQADGKLVSQAVKELL